jgi:pyridoxal phosphate enzyme (YggS family)
MTDVAALRARLVDVRERIARAAGRGGRDPSSVRLIAISKTVPADLVRAAVDLGQVEFGENRVQEALDKMDRTADLPIRWHLVGHLQSNKARKAGARFDVIHSVDDADLIGRLEEAAAGAGRRLDVLIQVDLAGEPTKHGVLPAAIDAILAAAAPCRSVRVAGLMLLPPAVDDPESARPYFAALRRLRDDLRMSSTGAGLSELSMGMSHDFEVAVEEGASMVRVGSAIFGPRPTAP